MIVKGVRLSYMHVFEPVDSFNDGRLAYSLTALIPKDDKETLGQVQTAIDKAIAAGLAAGKFKKGAEKLPAFKTPLRDGDEERALNPDSRGPEYEGCVFFNCRNTRPIGVVDKAVQPIRPEDRDLYYSGWYGNVDVNFYPFSQSGSVGIAAGLNNVMFTRAGDRLDGRQNAIDAFAGLAEEGDAEETSFE